MVATHSPERRAANSSGGARFPLGAEFLVIQFARPIPLRRLWICSTSRSFRRGAQRGTKSHDTNSHTSSVGFPMTWSTVGFFPQRAERVAVVGQVEIDRTIGLRRDRLKVVHEVANSYYPWRFPSSRPPDPQKEELARVFLEPVIQVECHPFGWPSLGSEFDNGLFLCYLLSPK